MSRSIFIVSNEPPPEGFALEDFDGYRVRWFMCLEEEEQRDFHSVLDLCRRKRAEGILAGSPSLTPLVTRCAESLGLLAVSAETAQSITDRALLLERLQAAQVPVISYRVALTEQESRLAASQLGEPVVVQSTEGGEGARSRYVQHLPEIPLAYRQVTKSTGSKRALLTHPERSERYSVFCQVHRGEWDIAAVLGVEVEPRFMYPMQISTPPPLEDATIESLREIAGKVVEAIRFRNGVVRVDMLQAENGFQVYGADTSPISNWMPVDIVNLSGAADLFGAALRTSVGKAPEPHAAAHQSAAIVWFPCRSGEVEEIDGIEEAENLPGVERIRVRIQPGDVVRHTVDQAGRDRIGYAIVYGPTHESCVERARQVVETVHVRTRTVYTGTAANSG